MAYNVTTKFRERVYSGSSNYKAKLKINNEDVNNSQISQITISSPIIDTTKETFYIGTFISQQITIKFKNLDGLDIKTGNEVYLEIGQYVDDNYEYVPIGHFQIDNLSENYQTTCEITCLDYATKFKNNIDYSPCFTDGKATIDTILQWICNYVGVEIGTYPNINGDLKIGTFDSTVSGKQWISYIAEIKGCNAKIGRDGKLYLLPIKQASSITINALRSKSWELGEKYKISQTLFSDGKREYSYGETTDNTLYIRPDNPFIENTMVIQNIHNAIKGFEIYSATNENYGDISLDSWDIITFTLGNDENGNTISYPVINHNTITYQMNIMTKINPKVPTKKQEVTTNVIGGNDQVKLKTLQTTVNLVDATVKTQAQEIKEQETKMSEISQTVDELNQKVEQAVDITTTSDSNTGSVIMKNINQGHPVLIKVHPISDDIAYLYPANYIYPSDNIYPKERKITFTNTETNEVFEYEIPEDLLYYDNASYDSLFLDFVNAKYYITKKVGVDDNGDKYLLQELEEITIPEPNIELTDGNYTIKLDGYSIGYIYVQLMQKNVYTTQFATKVELNTAITETSEEINLTVSKKVDKNEVISSINQSAEKVNIKANKIGLEGLVTANKHFKIDEKGSMEAVDGTFSGNIYFPNSGSKVIGGEGLLTNLQFNSGNDFQSCGFAYYYTTESIGKEGLYLNVFIPSNFTIESAIITLYHRPFKLYYTEYTGEEKNVWCYTRKINLYKYDTLNVYDYGEYESERFIDDSSVTSKIANAFGENGFTPKTPSDSDYETTNVISSDIKDSLSAGMNILKLQSDETVTLSGNETDQEKGAKASSYTGLVFASLNIIGYKSYPNPNQNESQS